MTTWKTVFFCAALLCNLDAFSQQELKAAASVSYAWKNVQISGGGFVDGIIFHPSAKNVRYCRTDMGGAYRWDHAAKRWQPMLDWVSYANNNLMGVESIAVDPGDPLRVYLACGTYTRSSPNAILRSDDGGRTFKQILVDFKMGGNENGRGNGERLVVDPKNSNVLYMGTRLDGLWKSIDRGASWQRLTGFPDISEAVPAAAAQNVQGQRRPGRGSGIVFVVFAPNGNTVYAGCSLMGRDNFYQSTNEGKTWQAVAGQPQSFRPTHASFSKDGTLYLTYGTNAGPDRMTDGAVWKFNTINGEWKDVTPDRPDPSNQKSFGYAAVSVDAQHEKTLIVSSFGRYGAGGENIFRSIDGGLTWKSAITGNGTFDYSLAPYVKHTGIHWLFDIEIDPTDANHAMFTTGYGGHETFNLSAADQGKPVIWSVMSTGIEETVALDLLSPSKGAQVITGIGDYGGFVHWNLDKPSPEGNFNTPHFAHTDGIAYAAANPDLIVRVGLASTQVGGGNIGYSLDAGKNWTATASVPQSTSQRGYICVSSDGNAWIWTPLRSAPYLTKDNGSSWVAVKGLPDNSKVIADPVNPLKFYAMALFDGKIFNSTDGGATFSEQALILEGGLPQNRGGRGDNRGGQDRIYAAPGKEGDVWVAAFDGLYHKEGAANQFSRNNAVQQIHAFGFGKEAPGSKQAAIYLVGTVQAVRGIFRSTDYGKTWKRINDDDHQWGLVLHITGDPKRYGRVYVGTHGRGTFYGDPQ